MNVNWDCGKLWCIDDDNCGYLAFVWVMGCIFGTKQSCLHCIAYLNHHCWGWTTNKRLVKWVIKYMNAIKTKLGFYYLYFIEQYRYESWTSAMVYSKFEFLEIPSSNRIKSDLQCTPFQGVSECVSTGLGWLEKPTFTWHRWPISGNLLFLDIRNTSAHFDIVLVIIDYIFGNITLDFHKKNGLSVR